MNTKQARLFITLLSLSTLGSIGMMQDNQASAKATKQSFAYVGTYTNKGRSKGIYLYLFDSSSGTLKENGVREGIKDPSFLAIHPNGKYLYAVSEVSETDGQKGGAVWSFSINEKTGALESINHQLSGGEGPCFIALDKSGRCALVANYNSGTIASFPIAEDGSLQKAKSVIQHKGSSIDLKRQQGPHAHSINFSPDGKWALAADLGLDKILVYKVDIKSATLEANSPAFCATIPGGGPRHLAFHPGGKFAYLSNEMKSSVTSMDFDSNKGTLNQIQTVSTLPEDISKTESEKNSTAEILVHPSGKFVYCSNRGHNSIAIFAVNSSTGTLSPIGHQSSSGKTPRNFCIDPSGEFLVVCNQDSDNIETLRIDKKTGKLSSTGSSVAVSAPVCIKFLLNN